MGLAEDTIQVQRLVGATADGIWGVQTARAVVAELQRRGVTVPADASVTVTAPPAALDLGDIDERSVANIRTLKSWVQPVAALFLRALNEHGIDAKIISGTRTYEEQDALYKQGGVTKARGGYSNHNFGIAFDIGIFESGKYLDESPLYAKAGAIGKAIGLSWGGDWQSFQDEPHFELKPGWAEHIGESQMLAEMRRRVANGEALV